MNTEKSLCCSNRCRDIVIFNLLGCRPPAFWISLDLCNGPNSHEGRTASPCQISSKSVEPRPRYGDFSIFQDGDRRHLGFLKSEIFNGWDAQEGWTASPYQISSKSLKPRLRYGHFTIFKMAAASVCRVSCTHVPGDVISFRGELYSLRVLSVSNFNVLP